MRNLITFILFKDALQELKTAIRASGEHKQRVVIHVAVDGLKIRDEKSGVSYTHLHFTYPTQCLMNQKNQFHETIIIVVSHIEGLLVSPSSS